MKSFHIIFSLCCATVIVGFTSCSSSEKKQTPEQLRELQKDSTICASYFGIPLGEGLSKVEFIVDSLEKCGKASSFSSKPFSRTESLSDAIRIIDALPIEHIVYFNSNLALKKGEQYKEVKVSNLLGFRNDSLYAVFIFPYDNARDLATEKVIDTYTEKYGELYHLLQMPKTEVSMRLDTDLYWVGQTHIYETNAISSESVVWSFKDADIYLANKTEYTTTYTYDSNSFSQEWRELQRTYGYDEALLCNMIKDRLYGKKEYDQKERPFISYKNMMIHERDSERIQKENEVRAKEVKQKRMLEDSLKNEKAKQSFTNQDI